MRSGKHDVHPCSECKTVFLPDFSNTMACSPACWRERAR